MLSVILFNHKIKNCGVYQYGKRLNDILQKSLDIIYIYIEIDCVNEYYKALKEYPHIKAIIYNYHQSTMSWLNNINIQKKLKNIGIPHESPEHLFDIICDIDPNATEGVNRFSIPRPIFNNIIANHISTNDMVNSFIKYSEENVPIFGSFGFGFINKGFDKIVTLINNQYDSAIIKFIIPTAHFDPNPQTVNIMHNMILNANTKKGIKIMILHEFLSDEDILLFLSSNTMNIFLYDIMHNRGISSTIDYALSVKKPLGISNSYMFRNIYSDEICLYKTPIKKCLVNSINYCNKFVNQYSDQNMIDKFKYILFNHI
jgi:hypothetical protein